MFSAWFETCFNATSLHTVKSVRVPRRLTATSVIWLRTTVRKSAKFHIIYAVLQYFEYIILLSMAWPTRRKQQYSPFLTTKIRIRLENDGQYLGRQSWGTKWTREQRYSTSKCHKSDLDEQTALEYTHDIVQIPGVTECKETRNLENFPPTPFQMKCLRRCNEGIVDIWRYTTRQVTPGP